MILKEQEPLTTGIIQFIKQPKKRTLEMTKPVLDMRLCVSLLSLVNIVNSNRRSFGFGSTAMTKSKVKVKDKFILDEITYAKHMALFVIVMRNT